MDAYIVPRHITNLPESFILTKAKARTVLKFSRRSNSYWGKYATSSRISITYEDNHSEPLLILSAEHMGTIILWQTLFRWAKHTLYYQTQRRSATSIRLETRVERSVFSLLDAKIATLWRMFPCTLGPLKAYSGASAARHPRHMSSFVDLFNNFHSMFGKEYNKKANIANSSTNNRHPTQAFAYHRVLFWIRIFRSFWRRFL